MRRCGGFSLLEVMLATAMFSIAVVGLAMNLDTMVGVVGSTARLQDAQRALDSAAMRLLASSNAVPPGPWSPVPGEKETDIQVEKQVKRLEGIIQIPSAPGIQAAPVAGWVVVRMRVLVDGEPVELGFLCNERR